MFELLYVIAAFLRTCFELRISHEQITAISTRQGSIGGMYIFKI